MLKFISLNNIRLFAIIVSLFTFSNAYSLDVAITVDDLPGVGSLPKGVSRLDVENQMLAVFKKHNLQGVYGMVIGGEVADNPEGEAVIKQWIAAGDNLGNHTYTHHDLATVSADFYIADIQKTDQLLSQYKLNATYKYFRYPYLSEGNTPEKRESVRAYLFSQGYQIAPVTVNFSDYLWNAPYARCMEQHNAPAIAWLRQTYIDQALDALSDAHYSSDKLFHRDISNILLIHLGPFDADVLDDVLTAYEKQGVHFINLSQAMSDPAIKADQTIQKEQAYVVLPENQPKDDIYAYNLVGKRRYASLLEKQLDDVCR